MSRSLRIAILSSLLASLVAACAPSWKEVPHDQRFQHTDQPILHRRPAGQWLPTDWWDRAHASTILPLARALSPARYVDRFSGGREALDINEFGEVPDSLWFHNRIGRDRMDPAVIARGPGVGEGPAIGALAVINGKLEGATPGLVVRDAAGEDWFVKFDPPAYRELSTGAELVAQRLLWAAGYWVPEMHVGLLDLNELILAKGATRLDEYGRTVAMDEEDLRDLITNLNPGGDNRVRALFSRSLPGDPIGPFTYRGVRIDDPNDKIPHERRRSLRGLWVLAAWINNTDVRQQNTLDTFLRSAEDPELGYVRHYLIDFGDSLGAAGERTKYIGEGYEGQVDWPAMLGRFLAGGLNYPYWLGVRRSPLMSVGVFEAEVFNPARWAPSFPNPAFIEATDEDTFWAASILARFDRPRVEAAVSAANYRNERAAKAIVDILMKRREKLLEYALRNMAPLIDPYVEGRRVGMRDLERVAALPRSWRRTSYHYQVRWNRTGLPDSDLASGSRDRPEVDLGPVLSQAPADLADDPFLTVSWRRRHQGQLGPRVELHLRVDNGVLIPVGLWREVD